MNTLKTQVWTALLVSVLLITSVFLSYKFGSLTAKSDELQKQLEHRDKEIDYLRGQVDKLQAALVTKKAENEALETKLGLLPDPSVPVPQEILEASRRNVLALVDSDLQEQAYKQLVSISYVETRHRPWLVGTKGETSNFQIMPYHYAKKDRAHKKDPDVGARYAIKVLNDFGAIEDPKKTWMYNGDPRYQGLILAANRLHFHGEPL